MAKTEKGTVLKKIDCVLLKVPSVEEASRYYQETFGLKRLWQDARSIGLGMPETDAEIVLHSDPSIPVKVDVNYLVADVSEAVEFARRAGCQLLVPPFDIAIGKCAVVQDPFGHTWSLLDMTKGERSTIH